MLRNGSTLFGQFIFFTSLMLILVWAEPAFSQDRHDEDRSSSSAWSFPIMLFQKTVSRADGDRCPMYPSCSHYASKAIERHGVITGWILSFDRLLRCGHDEIRLSPKVRIASGEVRIFDPIEANTRWWRRP
ncbi:MAG: membrane protein insertion efficiency factor YidD [Desulfobacteraceae bacterium]